ncbi:MAG TPA: FAD-binding oxidoreductase [Rubrobacteraceae bacterium]|nr:FAD-binding oxidoreductase [Rubrobacteraceae bacterium]
MSFVLPASAEEVELLSEVSKRYSVPLIAQGTRTAFEAGSEKGGILISFDLMRRTRLPANPEEAWAEAEPGALWLELDNYLHARGRSLAVYPTSAPRSTIGGWIASDGLGVGSFEYGWLHENVLSADVVLPGGDRREVRGDELRSFVGPGGRAGIIVGARLRTRRAEADLPFGATFADAEDLAVAMPEIIAAAIPLWHLAFLNPEMAHARGSVDTYLLFGAYPRERSAQVDEGLREVLRSHRGRILPAADAYHVWGERFFPMVPSHPIPSAVREFTSVAQLPEALVENHPGRVAIQGTVARSGEVLLLKFDPNDEGWEG